MMNKFYGSAVVIAALAFTGTAFANQIDVNTSGSEPSLYDIANSSDYGTGLDGKGLFSGLNAGSPQVNNGHWQIGGTGTSVSVLEATYTKNFKDATFGVYSMTDPSKKLNLLGGGTQNGANQDINTKGYLNYSRSGVFYSYIENARTQKRLYTSDDVDFGTGIFGYFLTIGGKTYYSDSTLNKGGEARMVGYAADGSGTATAGEYLLGWEDGTDGDYQDYVATVESVRPVPEPSSIAMFGAGLLMIGFAARRIQKRDV